LANPDKHVEPAGAGRKDCPRGKRILALTKECVNEVYLWRGGAAPGDCGKVEAAACRLDGDELNDKSQYPGLGAFAAL